MAAGSTYTPIATTTLGSNQTTVTLSSIPSTYTDLRVVIVPASSSGTNGIRMRINGDTGTNYSATYLTGTGSAANSGRTTSSANMSLGNYTGIGLTLGEVNLELDFMNYSNSTTYKTVLIRNNQPSNAVEGNVGLWRSTSAINSLSFNINTFGSSTGDFITGSTFTLYGIAAA
jgi:hypothetical protein